MRPRLVIKLEALSPQLGYTPDVMHRVALMAESYARLRAMSDEELVAAHDRQAQNMATGVDWYVSELHRRDETAKTQTMVRLTWAIAALTLVTTVAVVLSFVDIEPGKGHVTLSTAVLALGVLCGFYDQVFGVRRNQAGRGTWRSRMRFGWLERRWTIVGSVLVLASVIFDAIGSG